jgi:hypothetical protein
MVLRAYGPSWAAPPVVDSSSLPLECQASIPAWGPTSLDDVQEHHLHVVWTVCARLTGSPLDRKNG